MFSRSKPIVLNCQFADIFKRNGNFVVGFVHVFLMFI